MAYNKQNRSSGPPLSDPFWMIALILIILAFAVWALPAIIIAFIAQRYLQRILYWKMSFLIWFVTAAISVYILYHQYQTGLQIMMSRELALYVVQAREHQTDIAHWNIPLLWAATWPMWLRSLLAIPIAGIWFEVSSNATGNVARMLRQNEQHRQNRAQRSQKQARRRTRRPDRVPDEAGGMAVMGIPIKRKDE